MRKVAIVLVDLLGMQSTFGGLQNDKQPKDHIINASAEVVEL